jgi:putative aldouronate transport system substrate-binding protein
MGKYSKRLHTSLIGMPAIMIALSGCSSAVKPEASATKATADNPVSVNYMFDFNVDLAEGTLLKNKYVDFLQKKTGVKVVMDAPSSAGYADKLNIMMASGNPPDAFMSNTRDTILKFADQGLLTDLAPYINDTAKYPNIAKFMQKEAFLPVTKDGKIYAFPYSRFDALNQTVYINKLWMQKLNLPTPKTIEDFYQVGKAFTEQDPDGNGKNDTFGFLGNSGLFYLGQMFAASMDANVYKIINGKVTPPEITQEYKEYLKFMRKLVKDKLLDPEFVTTTTQIYLDKLKTGKYGITSNFWHGNQFPGYEDGTIDKVWEAIDLPVKLDGSPAKFSYNSINRHYIGIPATSKNTEVLMKFFDWVCSDEGKKWLYLGVEGDEYKMTNGTPEILKQKHSLHWGFSMVNPGQYDDEVKSYLGLVYPKASIDRLDKAIKNGALDKLQAALPYYPELSSFSLAKISDEYKVKAVLGNADIDSTWDDYVKNWRSAGGDKAIQFWTDWYNKEGKNIVK